MTEILSFSRVSCVGMCVSQELILRYVNTHVTHSRHAETREPGFKMSLQPSPTLFRPHTSDTGQTTEESLDIISEHYLLIAYLHFSEDDAECRGQRCCKMQMSPLPLHPSSTRSRHVPPRSFLLPPATKRGYKASSCRHHCQQCHM